MESLRDQRWAWSFGWACLAVVLLANPIGAQNPGSSPAVSVSDTVVVYNSRELADALANDSVRVAQLANATFNMTDADWDNYTVPVNRTTNLTITGAPGPSESWPVLGLGFVKGKIRLEGAAVLILHTDAGAMVLMQDAVLMLRICVPRTIQGEIMSSIPRPANLPGTQISISTSPGSSSPPSPPWPSGAPFAPTSPPSPPAPPACTNDTNAPPVRRCWPDQGVYVDVAVAGFDIDAFGRATATKYELYMLRVPYLCEKQMTDECVSALGPLGCFLYMFPRTPITGPPTSPSPSPRPTSAPEGGSKSSSSSSLPAIVGGVVGGVVALAAISLVVLLFVRRKRIQEETERKKAYEETNRLNRETGGTGASGAAMAGPNGKHGSPPVSSNGPPSANAAIKAAGGTGSTPQTGSLQQQSAGRNIITLPSGVGTCVLSSTDVDASSPLVIVTPFTPHRSDLKLDVQCDTEVKLLPVIRGKGSYGRVVEGLYGGQRVAVKLVVDVDEWSGPTDSLVSSFAQEVEVLGRCQHPNIVRLLAACLKPPRLCLVMELMDTSLERMVHGRPGELMQLPTVLHVAADIARGLAYLHPTIVHRDLKPGNVLLSNTDSIRPIAKLTDFGLSRLRSTVLVTRHPEAGTPAYMAPEAFDASNYVITHKADIYALGVILWEMLTGSVPWEGCSMVAIAYSITVRHHRLPLSKLDANRCPPKLRKLIHQCWDPDPQRRPAAAELVKQLTLVLQLVHGESEAAPTSNGSSQRSNANFSTDNPRHVAAAMAGAAPMAAKDILSGGANSGQKPPGRMGSGGAGLPPAAIANSGSNAGAPTDGGSSLSSRAGGGTAPVSAVGPDGPARASPSDGKPSPLQAQAGSGQAPAPAAAAPAAAAVPAAPTSAEASSGTAAVGAAASPSPAAPVLVSQSDG
ncbi:hypothetical protein HYH03_015874 [Edaphochlamys debaryana]|uniref:Protein kinase domain-containing protein n=1 Tax=Edaphochlamys debaryana TaxID=47281 RepID=A0A835XJS0_9CHLO|nr:hypothetical protein HYH03_015874 [Edaphochlamys debaryana]|eukprot:KAG2485388.1 hypothetical protein HYH03_015874 [Edaphochlamys debaryana]